VSKAELAAKAQARLALLAESEDLTQPGVAALQQGLATRQREQQKEADLGQLLRHLVDRIIGPDNSQEEQATSQAESSGEQQQSDSEGSSTESSPTTPNGDSQSPEDQDITEEFSQAQTKQEGEWQEQSQQQSAPPKQSATKCTSTNFIAKRGLVNPQGSPTLSRRVGLQVKGQLGQRGSNSKQQQYIASAFIRNNFSGTTHPGDL
jgi:hypothetical protein